MEMSRLTRDETAEPVSRDQILRRERGQGNIYFLCSPDHVKDWQPYPVDPYSCYSPKVDRQARCDIFGTIHLPALPGLKRKKRAFQPFSSSFHLQLPTTLVIPVNRSPPWFSWKPRNFLDFGTRVRISVQSHELGFFLIKIK